VKAPIYLGAALGVDVRFLRLGTPVIPPLFAGPPFVLDFGDLGVSVSAQGWSVWLRP
jgi:hypothetical protein